MSPFIFSPRFPYGAPELRANGQKFALQGLMVAVAIHGLALGCYLFFGNSATFFDQSKPNTGVIEILDWRRPPALSPAENIAVRIRVFQTATKPDLGKFVPVPDIAVHAEPPAPAGFPDTAGESTGLPGARSGSGDAAVSSSALDIADDVPPEPFVFREKDPVVIYRIAPAYPELARRARIEGTVWVKIWIDRKGEIREVKLCKSDAEHANC